MVLFNGIIGHSFNEDEILAIAEFLNSIKPDVQPCLSFLQKYIAPEYAQIDWQWATREGHASYEHFQVNWNVVVDEGNMFSAKISKRLFCLQCGYLIRWSEFLREPLATEGLRCLCRTLAKILGSESIIYVPDSGGPPSGVSGLLYSDAGIKDAVGWLQTNCGPPAETILSIFPDGAKVIDENGYYLEVV
ncbi:MAG: hypothetical protein AB7K41_15275 [Bdellovibrionales bacterium]